MCTFPRLFESSTKINFHERVSEWPRKQRLAEAYSLHLGDGLVHRTGGFERCKRGCTLQRRMGSDRASVLFGRAVAGSVLQNHSRFSSEQSLEMYLLGPVVPTL